MDKVGQLICGRALSEPSHASEDEKLARAQPVVGPLYPKEQRSDN